MSFSDAVQVLQTSPDLLQLYFPPRVWGGLMGLFCAGVLAFLAFRMPDRKSVWFFGVLGALFLFMAMDFFTYRATVTLSAATQTFSYEEKTFYYKNGGTFPLRSLEEAVIKAGSKQNRQFALLVASSPQITLGDGYNGRSNMFEAAHAVNAFLARNGHP